MYWSERLPFALTTDQLAMKLSTGFQAPPGLLKFTVTLLAGRLVKLGVPEESSS